MMFFTNLLIVSQEVIMPKTILWEGTAPSLSEAQEMVEGYVELVRLEGGDIMLVNEDGRMEKDPNQTASELAGQMIFGDVVVIRNQDRGDNW